MRPKFLEREKRVHRPYDVSRALLDFSAGSGTIHDGVLRSMEYMVGNFKSPVQLKEVVAESRLSRRGFIGAFIRHMGRSPGAVLRQMRIEYARHLLETEDLPLTVIARRTGFRSENTFCVAFHREVGLAPTNYQRQLWLTERRNQQKFGIPPLKLTVTNQSNCLDSFVRT